jgi:DNA uptake protein ComE-like DNA-binding protein
MACLVIIVAGAVALWPGRGATKSAALPAAQIDINRADAATLSALPSIGSALSQRIVEDRAANGPYAKPEDLLRVKGITSELLSRIKPFLVGFERSADAGPEAGP